MSYAIVFSSKTGNTELLADALHSYLPQADCCYFGSPNPAAMEANTLYVGFWTDKGKADESSSDFLKQLRGHLQLLDSRLMKLSRMKHSQDIFGKHIQVYML